MLISVIIPCFNSEKYIRVCIESVLEQTYKNFEIVLVNDGSVDRTEEIVKSYNDTRVKYHYKVNGGLSSARNYGIICSSGEYIAFLDSDDYWRNDKLDKQIRLMNDYDVCYSDFCLVDEFGRSINREITFEPFLEQSALKNELLVRNVILGSGSGVLLKRNVVEGIGFFRDELKIGEDWDYWARAAWRDYKFGFLNEELVIIRKNSSSIQNTSHSADWKSSLDNILNSFLSFEGLSRSNAASIFKKLSLISYRYGDSFSEIAKYSFKSIQADPAIGLNKCILFSMIRFYPRKIMKTFKSLRNG
jgi:glycosyltransferase involved in cell wall biosynthesis